MMALLAASLVATAQPIEVFVNDARVNFDEARPRLTNGRVLVPLRGVFEEMGATVDWIPSTLEIKAYRGPDQVRLIIDDPVAYINDEQYVLDAPPRMTGGYTYVPLRFVGEAFGARVDWHAATHSVHIEIPPVAAAKTTHVRHVFPGGWAGNW